MKTKLLAILAASALAFTFTSCSNDDDTTPDNGGDVLSVLNGNITGNATLASSVRLTGATIVRSGATLTIPAGTTISADASGTAVYLLVEQGAKIIAEGTATSPIVFTSAASSPKAGDWGGVIINGYAPLSGPTGTTGSTEINTDIPYGGTNVSDNSGVLDYVKIEYTGAKIDDDSEHNGLTLNGVGNGTKISNIYIKDGADDGIEFFGGSVNVTNLLVVNSQDDMFDCTQGYTGTLTNSYGIWEASYTSSSNDPRGIEADGNLDGDFPTHSNQSAFTVTNMTIVNKSTTSEMNDVVKIRRGAKATITNLNIQVAETAKIADIIDFADTKGAGDAASTIQYSITPASLFSDSKIKNTIGAVLTRTETAQVGATTSAFSWTGYSF